MPEQLRDKLEVSPSRWQLNAEDDEPIAEKHDPEVQVGFPKHDKGKTCDNRQGHEFFLVDREMQVRWQELTSYSENAESQVHEEQADGKATDILHPPVPSRRYRLGCFLFFYDMIFVHLRDKGNGNHGNGKIYTYKKRRNRMEDGILSYLALFLQDLFS